MICILDSFVIVLLHNGITIIQGLRSIRLFYHWSVQFKSSSGNNNYGVVGGKNNRQSKDNSGIIEPVDSCMVKSEY